MKGLDNSYAAEPISAMRTIAHDDWLAAQPSGAEKIYTVYTESFKTLAWRPSQTRQIANPALTGGET
jgi:phosphoglucomutase